MFWLLGSPSIMFTPMEKYCQGFTGNNTQLSACYDENSFNIWNKVRDFIFSWQTWLSVGIAVATVAILGGLNLLVIVPFALAFLLLEFVVFPTSIIINNAGYLPEPLPALILAYLSFTTMLVLISFIRTGQ